MIQIKYSNFIIIGSGPAGYTSCIYISRSNLNPILITGKELGGQLANTAEVENWPGFIYISGSELMNNMLNQIKYLDSEINFNYLYSVDILIKPIILFSFIKYYLCDVLVISTGASPRYLQISAEKNYLGKNISTCAVCDGNFYKNKIVLVIGGGNTAIENAIYLSNISKKIIVIHRNKNFSSEQLLLKNFFINTVKKNILIKLNTILIDMIGDYFSVKYVKIKNIINNITNIVNIDGIFVSIGNIPNSTIFNGQLILYSKYILVKDIKFHNVTSVSISGIFCSGDIQDFIYKQAIISSGLGCISSFDSIYYYNKLNSEI